MTSMLPLSSLPKQDNRWYIKQCVHTCLFSSSRYFLRCSPSTLFCSTFIPSMLASYSYQLIGIIWNSQKVKCLMKSRRRDWEILVIEILWHLLTTIQEKVRFRLHAKKLQYEKMYLATKLIYPQPPFSDVSVNTLILTICSCCLVTSPNSSP